MVRETRKQELSCKKRTTQEENPTLKGWVFYFVHKPENSDWRKRNITDT